MAASNRSSGSRTAPQWPTDRSCRSPRALFSASVLRRFRRPRRPVRTSTATSRWPSAQSGPTTTRAPCCSWHTVACQRRRRRLHCHPHRRRRLLHCLRPVYRSASCVATLPPSNLARATASHTTTAYRSRRSTRCPTRRCAAAATSRSARMERARVSSASTRAPTASHSTRVRAITHALASSTIRGRSTASSSPAALTRIRPPPAANRSSCSSSRVLRPYRRHPRPRRRHPRPRRLHPRRRHHHHRPRRCRLHRHRSPQSAKPPARWTFKPCTPARAQSTPTPTARSTVGGLIASPSSSRVARVPSFTC